MVTKTTTTMATTKANWPYNSRYEPEPILNNDKNDNDEEDEDEDKATLSRTPSISSSQYPSDLKILANNNPNINDINSDLILPEP